MPAVLCPRCKNELTQRVAACPHCGVQFRAAPKPPPPPAEGVDPEAARIFAEAFTARYKKPPTPAKPAAAASEAPVSLDARAVGTTAADTATRESLDDGFKRSLSPGNLIPAFGFFALLTHMVLFTGRPVGEWLVTVLVVATACTSLTLTVDFVRFSRK